MATELEEGLARLSYIEDAYDIGILGKGGQEVGIMWRGRQPQERWRVCHGLLRKGRADTAAVGIYHGY